MKALILLTEKTAPAVRLCIWAMAGIAGAALAFMAAITAVDVIARTLKLAVPGAYDLVGIAGAITVAGAVPLTKAVKGHVAIEYFYHRAGRRGRHVMDTLSRLLMLAFFSVMAWQCFTYGLLFLEANEVTPTLYLPVFWIPWVIGLSCILTAFVTLYHLAHPGRPMIAIHAETGKETAQ